MEKKLCDVGEPQAGHQAAQEKTDPALGKMLLEARAAVAPGESSDSEE
jgi:hypothetical protein